MKLITTLAPGIPSLDFTLQTEGAVPGPAHRAWVSARTDARRGTLEGGEGGFALVSNARLCEHLPVCGGPVRTRPFTESENWQSQKKCSCSSAFPATTTSVAIIRPVPDCPCLTPAPQPEAKLSPRSFAAAPRPAPSPSGLPVGC